MCWATDTLVFDDITVSALARHLGMDWHTLWDAIAEEAATRVEQQRTDARAVPTVGVDEHIWRPSRHGATDRAVTTMRDTQAQLTMAVGACSPRRVVSEWSVESGERS